MRSSCSQLVCLVLVACGGGGGDSPTPPVAANASLQVAPVELLASETSKDLVVSLSQAEGTAPALMQMDIELPPELTLPSSNRLTAATPLVTLEGNYANNNNNTFAVLCGDASNRNAQALPNGALFRLRLVAASPRSTGSFIVTIKNVRAATSAGESVALANQTLTAAVTIR
jgi:hypothetical protein